MALVQAASIARRAAISHRGVLLSALLVACYHTWLGPGATSSGDMPYYRPTDLRDWLPVPSLWDSSTSTGGYDVLQGPMFPVLIAQALLADLNVGWALIERLIWIFPAVLLPALATYALARSLFGIGSMAVISALAMVMNSYVYLLYQGSQFGVAIAAGCIPLVLWAFVRGERQQTPKAYLLTALCMSLQAMYDIRSTYITLGVVLLYVIIAGLPRHSEIDVPGLRRTGRSLIHLGVAFTAFASLQLWWLLPIFLVGRAELPSGYTDISGVQALSFVHVSQGLALFHPYWFANDLRLNPIDPLFFLAPLAIFALMLIRWRNRQVLFVLALAVISIFLVKGMSDPAGGIYEWLFVHYPGFSYYRDPTKFYQPLTLAYALLLGVVAQAGRRLAGRFAPPLRRASSAFVLLLAALVAVYPSYPALLGWAGGAFSTTSVPTDYATYNDLIDHQSGFFRVLWAPARPRFATYSVMHPSLDAGQISTCCQSTSVPASRPWQWLGMRQALAILQALAVRYVVVPDAIGRNDLIGASWPTGDSRVPPATILAAVRSALPHARELRIGRLHLFAIAGASPLLYGASSVRSSLPCGQTVPCYTTLARDAHAPALTPSGRLRVVTVQNWPTRHQVDIEVSHAPAYLVFAQTYDPHWLASVQAIRAAGAQKTAVQAIDHVVAFGYANAWLFRRAGRYRVTLEYWPQRLVLIGGALSAVFLLCYIYLLLRGVRRHRVPQAATVVRS
jgi:hypothetical protein